MHWHRREFLNRTPIPQALTSTIDKWALMKLKSFYKAPKDTISKEKKMTHYRLGKDSFNSTSDRGMTSKIYKVPKKVHISKLHNQILKMGYGSKQNF